MTLLVELDLLGHPHERDVLVVAHVPRVVVHVRHLHRHLRALGQLLSMFAQSDFPKHGLRENEQRAAPPPTPKPSEAVGVGIFIPNKCGSMHILNHRGLNRS